MTEELEIFLKDNTTPEIIDLLQRAFDIFEDLYPVDIWDVYNELIFTQDSSYYDTGEVYSKIVGLTRTYLYKILTEHSIVVPSDIDIYRLICITEALLNLTDYEDSDTIDEIVTSDSSSEEKISELLALVSELTSEEIILHIESVDDSLITRIHEEIHLIKTDSVYTEMDDSLIRERVEEIKLFKSFIHNKPLLSTKLLDSNIRIGFPFETYFNFIDKDIGNMDTETIAQELFVLCMMSIDGFSNPKSIVKKYIERSVSDLRQITLVDIKLTELMMKYQAYKDSIKYSTEN